MIKDNNFPVEFTEVYPGRFEIHLSKDAKFTPEIYRTIVNYANSYPADNNTYYTLVPNNKKFDKILKLCGFRLVCLVPNPDGGLLKRWVRVND